MGNLKRFRKLMNLLSCLMQIDLPYIISHMQWVRTGVFEMTNTLTLSLFERCAHKGNYFAKTPTGKATVANKYERTGTDSANALWTRLSHTGSRVSVTSNESSHPFEAHA